MLSQKEIFTGVYSKMHFKNLNFKNDMNVLLAHIQKTFLSYLKVQVTHETKVEKIN